MTSAEKAITDWLRARGASAETIDPDHDLIENRLLDSLHFMEFVLLLEEHTGRDILVDGPSLGQFRTLRAIRDNFLAVGDAAGVEEEEVVI